MEEVVEQVISISFMIGLLVIFIVLVASYLALQVWYFIDRIADITALASRIIVVEWSNLFPFY